MSTPLSNIMMALEPHEERLLAEFVRVKTDIAALRKFINTKDGIFQTLPEAEKDDQRSQLSYMVGYLSCLGWRIDRVGRKATNNQ